MKHIRLLLALILVCALMAGSCAMAWSTSYTKRLAGSTEVYAGPGYAYGYTRDVGKDGIYTIVEERYDETGNLWGRMKSGIGWVMLQNAAATESYKIKLKEWIPLYKGPGYEYGTVRTVGVDGTFTIVEERYDEAGNLWGRMKSGSGWVDLTYVKAARNALITASHPNPSFLEKGEFMFYELGDYDFSESILFRAHEPLRDVELSILDYNGKTFCESEELIGFEYFAEDTSFVAKVPFWGDATTYGISFTDGSDIAHYFAVYISGCNGAVIMEEYHQY